jgi:uncharacterized protein (DUF433 family)
MKQILADYPDLGRADIEQSMLYAAAEKWPETE